jgi:hypothetical protein
MDNTEFSLAPYWGWPRQPLRRDGYADIIVTRSEVALRRYSETYQWVGDRRAPVLISWEEMGRDFPWPMKRIEDCWDIDAYVCVRTDVYFWWLTAFKIAMSRPVGKFNSRLKLTAMVWGLVHFDMRQPIPAWKDLLGGKRDR